MTALTYASLFAGLGGADIGLEQAGLRPIIQVERDADCVATQRARGSTTIRQLDVGDLPAILEAMKGEEPFLGWASPPCQGFSPAGKLLGRLDPRDGWAATERWMDAVVPRWFLVENSAGLLRHPKRCPMWDGTLDLFGEPDPTCGACYAEEWKDAMRRHYPCVGTIIVDPADYGLPQNRPRAIVWAGPAPLELPPPTHGPLRPHPHVTVGEALGLLPRERRVGGGGNPHGKGRHHERNYRDLTDEPSVTVCAEQFGTRGPWVVVVDDAEWTVQIDQGRSPEQQRPRSPAEPAPTIGTKGNLLFRLVDPRPLQRPAPAVTTTDVKGTRASGKTGWTFNGGPDRVSDVLALSTGYAVRPGSSEQGRPGPGRVRRATVRQNARLQGLPDDLPMVGSKRSMYRQVGNAVPPMLSRLLARAAMAADPAVSLRRCAS
jgi:site-specific DNA-cytosine methylase